jgi:hypothetical protein
MITQKIKYILYIPLCVYLFDGLCSVYASSAILNLKSREIFNIQESIVDATFDFDSVQIVITCGQ